jgi:predicted phosphodiesterase
MQIQLVSDLHTEFHADSGMALVSRQLDNTDVDVLVLAGDVVCWKHYEEASKVLSVLCERYPHVVYVTGNHEYYGSSFDNVRMLIEKVARKYPNKFHWLENSSVVIDGQRFIGCTLWFPEPTTAVRFLNRKFLSDYSQIKDFEPEVYNKHRFSCGYLFEEIKKTDIVITHHMPSYRLVAPEYISSSLNNFFAVNLDELLVGGCKLWVCGHTHTGFDTTVFNTRVICNPLGYPREKSAFSFNPHLIVEV